MSAASYVTTYNINSYAKPIESKAKRWREREHNEWNDNNNMQQTPINESTARPQMERDRIEFK